MMPIKIYILKQMLSKQMYIEEELTPGILVERSGGLFSY
jgi:hypothetical protein